MLEAFERHLADSKIKIAMGGSAAAETEKIEFCRKYLETQGYYVSPEFPKPPSPTGVPYDEVELLELNVMFSARDTFRQDQNYKDYIKDSMWRRFSDEICQILKKSNPKINVRQDNFNDSYIYSLELPIVLKGSNQTYSELKKFRNNKNSMRKYLNTYNFNMPMKVYQDQIVSQGFTT